MTYLNCKKLIAIITLGILLLAVPTSAFAAAIQITPHSGSLSANRPISIAVVIDETADAFNAAQANVTLSNNLTVADLVMGDCEFSFIKTPSIQDPSFVGVSLGTAKKNCTVYTLSVLPNGSDPATIALTNGSVKRHGDAKELLTAVQNGNYTVGSENIGTIISNLLANNVSSDSLVPVTSAASTIETESNLDNYTVSVKVFDTGKNPLANSTVTLQPQLQATDAQVQEIQTNKDGVAEFKNVSPNVYTVRAKHDGDVIAEQIMNAQGKQPILTMGLQDEKPSQNPWIPAIAGAVMLGIVAFFLRSRLRLWLHP
jgi:hypothetical protein